MIRCSIQECHSVINGQPFGSCQNCERVIICDKQDDTHYNTLLYNEGCREHHGGGYSVCLYCALEAFQTKMYKQYITGEEHCICPECSYDFGPLTEIPDSDELVKSLAHVKEDGHCSIEGCVPVQNKDGRFHDWTYGSCQSCCEFSLCYRSDPEHEAALLYNEGCREHHSGGYSICLPCTTKKFVDDTEHCFCPECDFDFGAVKDLEFNST